MSYRDWLPTRNKNRCEDIKKARHTLRESGQKLESRVKEQADLLTAYHNSKPPKLLLIK